MGGILIVAIGFEVTKPFENINTGMNFLKDLTSLKSFYDISNVSYQSLFFSLG
jgi:hypothetical protein